MRNLEELKNFFQANTCKITFSNHPQHLYEPIKYTLDLGGKQIRPLLVLLSNEMFNGEIEKALNPAMAIEWFHNFTLMHDDIMDNAPLRRGNATVYSKWGINTAILSGDVLLVKAYQLLEPIEKEIFKDVFALFNQTAIEVCEGQQLDMNFEKIQDVEVEEYLQMIRLKTAVLLACALKLGAIVAKTTPKNADLMYQIGENLGLAFQLQDDYLDVFGNPKKFGKALGGDIVANKKTFLLLTALKDANATQKQQLKYWMNDKNTDTLEKVDAVKQIFVDLNIQQKTQQKINQFSNLAFDSLAQLCVPQENKIELENLIKQLLLREL